MFRSPAVAGRFYPARKEELLSELSSYLKPAQQKQALGIISPHAGYMFSGRIAGETFAQVEVPELVVLLGPNHYGVGTPLALWEGEGWTTPLGTIRIDASGCQRIRELCPLVSSDSAAHRQEHSLEVQVPFIQALNPDAQLLPIAVGVVTLSQLRELGRAIATLIEEHQQQVLIVASSDMTHFETAESASRKDHLALDHVLKLDPEGLFRTVRDQQISMCGVLPVVTMLYALHDLGATHATLVDYSNSGEITGDYQDVVGYAGVVIT